MLKLSYEISCALTFAAMQQKPFLHTLLSPRLLDLYDVENSIVVIIDVFRATSTIATALYNGAEKIIPVAGVEDCILIGKSPEKNGSCWSMLSCFRSSCST